MEELIKITRGENGKNLVSARELHEFLGVKTAYKDWFPRMCEYGFVENQDYTLVAQKRATNNPKNPITTLYDHAISVAMAKELSMIQRNEKGKQARQYFIMCEEKFKEITRKQLPENYLAALKALVKAEEEKALMQPQVEYYQKVLNPGDSQFVKLVSITAIAKDLGMTAQKLNKTLNELHVIYKSGDSWVLYAEHEDKIPEYADYAINEYSQSLKYTEKGRKWIVDLLTDAGLVTDENFAVSTKD